MKFGILSDTHNRLLPGVIEVLQGVDIIIHAGDIGSREILTDLETVAPVWAVYGNTDTFPVVQHYEYMLFKEINALRFCITHIVSMPKALAYRLFKMGRNDVNVVIFGHTHRMEYQQYRHIHFINPGSASRPKAGDYATVARLESTAESYRLDFFDVVSKERVKWHDLTL